MNITEIRKALNECDDDELSMFLEKIAIAHVVGMLLGSLGPSLALEAVKNIEQRIAEEEAKEKMS